MSYLGIKELPTEPKSSEHKSSESTELEVIKKLVDALKGTVDGYCHLIDSDDCGNWNPRQDEFIINANRAMVQARVHLLNNKLKSEHGLEDILTELPMSETESFLSRI